MRILTLDNEYYNLETLPEEIDDLRFAILDNSNPSNVDYHYIPLIFLESFNAPALVLKIGNSTIKMPIDWQILIGEQEHGDLETLPLTSINDRGFNAFIFNPISDSKPIFAEVDIVDIYQEVKWYFPKIKSGQILAVPLTDDDNPPCAYFVKDISRQSEFMDYGSVW
jgi:hypothetical protein